MKPSHTRLTCRAHNRFSPSLLLWQCFIGTHPSFPHHQRLSSTATDPTQHGAARENGPPYAREASGLSQSESKVAKEEGAQPAATPKLNITRLKTDKGTWHASKASASGAKNVQKLYFERMASLTEPEKLLATARTAFEEARDYVGEVVQPMVSPIRCKESSLPWCLSKQETTMSGIDRLGVEIDRFYDFSKPNHLETLARRHVIEQVRDHVRQILPNHVLEVFGSERTGLALATSDIDFRLMVRERLEDPTVAKLPPTPEQRSEGMTSLHKLHWGGLFKNKAYMLANLRYARYPLISLQDRNSGLDIQIVLSNDTSISRDFIKRYMEQHPYLRQLYVVVKTMFDVRGLSDVYRGGFGSYSLFMMLVASLKHSPHPRNDAAGGLINFLKFYRSFQTAKWGISIEPVSLFDKQVNPVLTDRVRAKLAEGTAKPLPPYMLCLRDPADETNDLGRKAIAIKHVQTTFKKLCYDLDRSMTVNTRASLLGPLVGSSYMLNKDHRDRLRFYGSRLSKNLKASLAAKAKLVRDREIEADNNKQAEEENEQARQTQEAAGAEWQRQSEARNKKVVKEAERTAVPQHGDVIASILGMPSIEHTEVEKSK